MTQERDDPFFAAEYETANGWGLPLTGNLVSYLYFGLSYFAFEVWLGGDHDVTVRLLQPFTYGRDGQVETFDPGAGSKSSLGPLLDIRKLTVAEFLVEQSGRLEIAFNDETRLVADAAPYGRAWQLEWPVADLVGVAAVAGGGLEWPAQEVRGDVRGHLSAAEWAALEPVRRNGITHLPIRGTVTESPVSGVSIELAIPIAEDLRFEVHLGGAIRLTDADGIVWHGRGDSENRSILAPILGLVGNRVVDATMDESERLRVEFADGVSLNTDPDDWEATWPMSIERDDFWVPREGPSIP